MKSPFSHPLLAVETMTLQLSVYVGPEPFFPAEEYQSLEQEAPKIGAICTFVGLVRELGNRPDIKGLTLEHYPGMTERSIEAIAEEAGQRWSLDRVRVVHRVGDLAAGERIVFVGVSSSHRQDAYAACEFIMDYLKARAPFWKKEWSDTESYWVDQKESDRERARRWQ